MSPLYFHKVRLSRFSTADMCRVNWYCKIERHCFLTRFSKKVHIFPFPPQRYWVCLKPLQLADFGRELAQCKRTVFILKSRLNSVVPPFLCEWAACKESFCRGSPTQVVQCKFSTAKIFASVLSPQFLTSTSADGISRPRRASKDYIFFFLAHPNPRPTLRGLLGSVRSNTSLRASRSLYSCISCRRSFSISLLS